jgi:hypothetical protein
MFRSLNWRTAVFWRLIIAGWQWPQRSRGYHFMTRNLALILPPS